MTISGTGNFDRVTCPTFPQDGHWKTYTPTSTFNDKGAHFDGEKIFEQAVVATINDIKQIPSLRFSYFDPQQERYITTTTEPIPLQILGNPVSPSQPAAQPISLQGPEVQPQLDRTTTIRLETGKFTDEIRPLFREMWFIAPLCNMHNAPDRTPSFFYCQTPCFQQQ